MPPDTRLLIIPDIHQNHRFLQKIFLREEVEAYDRVIFLGDIFDPKDPEFDSPASVLWIQDFLISLKKLLGHKMVLLLGNHDVPFYYFSCLEHQLSPKQQYSLLELHGFSSWMEYKAMGLSIRKELFDDIRMAHAEAGWLFSHAGIKSSIWNEFAGNAPETSMLDKVLTTLNHSIDKAVSPNGDIDPLFLPGKTRGGLMDQGGPLWLDFDDEFEDDLPLPQMVGHTVGSAPRACGRSHCIDTRQTGYARISASGIDNVPISS